MAIRRFSTAEPGVKSNKFWDQDTQQGAIVPIASFVSTTSTTNFVGFNGIPQTYQDLYLVVMARTDLAANHASISVYHNGQGTTGMSVTNLSGNGASALSNRYTTASPVYGFSFGDAVIPSASSTAGIYGVHKFHILNYANTSTFKTCLMRSAGDLNGSGNTYLSAGLSQTTQAVTSIGVGSNGNFIGGSTFTLYGIKAGA